MKKAFWLAAMLIGASAALSQTSTWGEDLEKAAAQAKKEAKVLLINFTGSDWCPWCVKLDNEVFSKDEFKKYAQKNLVLLKADFPRKRTLPDSVKKQNEALAKKYGVEGFPTVVLVDSKGVQIAQTGYQQGGAAAYVEHLKGIIAKTK